MMSALTQSLETKWVLDSLGGVTLCRQSPLSYPDNFSGDHF